MRSLKFFIFFLLGLSLSCSNDDDNSNIESSCDFDVIIDEQLFEEPSPSVYSIVNAEINGNCLEIEIGASGCNANSWVVFLVSDLPVEAGGTGGSALSLKLTNTEVCEVYFTRIYSFDLSVIADENTNTVFGLEGWEGILEISNQ